MRALFILSFLAIAFFADAQAKPGDSIRFSPDVIQRDTVYNSTVIINDVTAAYDNMEQSIEEMYNKLIKDAKDNKDELAKQIAELDEKIEEMKKQIQKLRQMMEKIDALLTELENDKSKSIDSLRKQKEKTLDQIKTLIKNKKSSQAVSSRPWVIQINKSKEDSLKKIRTRYSH